MRVPVEQRTLSGLCDVPAFSQHQAERQKSKQLRASLRECDITAQQAAKERGAFDGEIGLTRVMDDLLGLLDFD